MKTETRLQIYRAVVDILAGQEPRPLSEEHWIELLAVAERQRVLPFVVNSLLPKDSSLPGSVREQLDAIARDSRQSAFWFAAELKGLVSAFTEADIDVVPLKGPCFAERVYGGSHLRSVRDLDMLVRRTQLTPARQLLIHLGFQLHRTDCEYHETWKRASTVLELHWDVAETALFDFDIDSAWQLVRPGCFSGQEALCLQPTDELLFICIHGTRHCFENLGLVLDVALLLEQLAASGDSGEMKLRPEASHLMGVLMLGCKLAQHLRPGKPLPFASPWPEGDRMDISNMAEEHWQQLSRGSMVPKRWPQARRFYRRTVTTRRGRMLRAIHDMYSGLSLLVQGDGEWAEKIGREYRISWLVRTLLTVRRRRRP